MFQEKGAKKMFRVGLQCLSFCLGQAMADEDLIAYLRPNKLDAKRAKELPRLAWAEDKMKLEKVNLRYLIVFLLGSLFLTSLSRGGIQKWML